MGLKATIAAAVSTAFDAIDDVKRAVTYHSYTGITRDIAAGTNTRGSTSYPLKRCLPARFSVDTNDKTVALATDEKLLFPAADLPVLPKTADWFVDEDGREWEVVKRLSDPAASLVTLHVRSTKQNG